MEDAWKKRRADVQAVVSFVGDVACAASEFGECVLPGRDFLLRRLCFSPATPQLTKSAAPLSPTALAFASAATKKTSRTGSSGNSFGGN